MPHVPLESGNNCYHTRSCENQGQRGTDLDKYLLEKSHAWLEAEG